MKISLVTAPAIEYVLNVSLSTPLLCPFTVYCLKFTLHKHPAYMCVLARLRACSCVYGGVRICYSNQAVRVIWSILAGRHTDSPPARAEP